MRQVSLISGTISLLFGIGLLLYASSVILQLIAGIAGFYFLFSGIAQISHGRHNQAHQAFFYTIKSRFFNGRF